MTTTITEHPEWIIDTVSPLIFGGFLELGSAEILHDELAAVNTIADKTNVCSVPYGVWSGISAELPAHSFVPSTFRLTG